MKMIEIEYTKDVQAYSGHRTDFEGNDTASVISKGTRRKVDEPSAQSLVKKKVAKIITAEDRQKEAAAAAKSASAAGDSDAAPASQSPAGGAH